MKTVNVPPLTKLSKQQRLILSILEEHNGEISQRELTQIVAEKTGKYKHISKQNYIDHAIKTLRETEEPAHAKLLSLLFTDIIQKMPRRGCHYVTESGRASVCRSILRLEKRQLVRRTTLWGKVYLADKFPERFKEDMFRARRVNWRFRAREYMKNNG